MRIFSIKAAPEDIQVFIEILGRNEENISKAKTEIQRYLQEKSIRKNTRQERNSIYAIALPSLRKLAVIDGHGTELRLNTNGKQMYDIISKGKEMEYRKMFAKIIIQIDKKENHLIEVIQKMNKSEISLKDVINEAKNNGYEFTKNDDKLIKWLRYLEYAGLLRKNENNIRLAISAKWNENEIKVSMKKFEAVFFKAYNFINITKMRNANYVAIPDLRLQVCKNLSENGFTTFDFDNYFRKIYQNGIKSRQILLSKPGRRVSDGIKIGEKYYYYISIYAQTG
jgi:hypothetical protein